MHFPISARATLMEEPSHQRRCNDITEKKTGGQTGQKNQKKEEAITPDYPSCSHVMQLQVEGMERIAPAPPKKTSPC